MCQNSHKYVQQCTPRTRNTSYLSIYSRIHFIAKQATTSKVALQTYGSTTKFLSILVLLEL